MAVYLRSTLAASCLLVAAGCITDDLVVYKDSVVSKEAAKRYLGVYQVEAWPGDMKPETIRVSDENGELSFSYSVPGKDYKLRFVLSKIPDSKKDLYLLSIPSQDDTNQSNMFFIGRADEGQASIWAVFDKLPVARDHLEFQRGKADAEDVKEFLKAHADAFVMANEPQVRLKNPTD